MKWLSLKIGGQRWSVYVVSPRNRNLIEDGRRCVGTCEQDKCRIYISRDLDESAREDVLLHELLHAVLGVSGADEAYDKDNAIEEDIVKSVTPVLHRLLIDLGFSFPSV